MNNTFKIAVMFLLGVELLMVSSCAKDLDISHQNGELVEYTLQAEVAGTGAGLDIDTKVALDFDGVTPNWESGDKILVLGEDRKPIGVDGIFTLIGGVGSASGTFYGFIKEGQTAKYAIYPASAAILNGDNEVTAGNLSNDKFGFIKSAIMLGISSDGHNFAFNNACAVIKLNTGDYGSGSTPMITNITVSASYGATPAPISGTFSIDWSNFSIETSPSGAITELSADLPGTLSGSNRDIFIPILPLLKQGTTSPSMKFVFININDAPAEVEYNFSDAITEGTIKNVGTAAGLEFGNPDPARSWVNLGMVSDSGHPLLVSKRDVLSIDADGVATLTQTIDETGGIFKTEDYTGKALYYNDNPCTLMSTASLLSFLNDENVSFQFDGTQWHLDSNIGSGSLILNPVTYGSADSGATVAAGCFVMDLSSNTPCCKRDSLAKVNGTRLRLLREDTSVTYGFTDVKATRDLKSGINYPKISEKVMSDDEVFNGNNNSTLDFGIELSCENGYKLYSFEKVPTGIVDIIPDNVTGGTLSVKDGNEYALVSTGAPSSTSPLNAQVKFYCNSKLKHTYSYTRTCFAKGTLITLADGSRKKIEELTYDDDLLVWNFDDGCYDSTKLLWITKPGLVSDGYFKVTLSDGAELRLTGSEGHKLFNYSDKTFEYATEITPGKQIFTENGIVTLVSCERIEEEVEYYSLVSYRHINCFAEGVLTSTPLNDIYPIGEDMKFKKDGRKIRPWREFRKAFRTTGMSRDWYEGARLGEQPYSIEQMMISAENLKSIQLEKPEPGFFERIWNWIKSLFSGN